MGEEDFSEQLYELGALLLRALEFNASCVIAAYNTSDADRQACLEHVCDIYDLFSLELDALFGDEDEDDDEYEEDDEDESL